MKKILLLLTGVVILIYTYCPKDFIDVTKFCPDKSIYTVYCKSIDIKTDGVYGVYDNGIYTVGSCYFFEAESLKKHANEIKGESIEFYGTQKAFDDICDKLNVKLCDRQKVADTEMIYGFSPKFDRYIILDGNKVNVQITFDGETIKIASPINLGEY